MAPIKTWAWSLPDPPPTTVMLQVSTSAQQKPRKRRSGTESSSADAPRPSTNLTALPAQPKNSSQNPDRPDSLRGTRRGNDVPTEGSRYSLFRGRKKGRAQSTTIAIVPAETSPMFPSRPSPQEVKAHSPLHQDHFESEEDCKLVFGP
nr:hypothetical protein CFP56_34730 [Quercus suber]